MEIRVNNELLDIANGSEVTMQYTNYRFANSVADQFSTELELPRTEDNQRILSAFIQLDNVWQTFDRKIYCSATVSDLPEDGYLQVTKLGKDTITATLFLSLLPFDLLSQKVNEVMRGEDTPATIKPFDRNADTTNRSGHTTQYEYTYYRYSEAWSGANQFAHQHLSGHLNQICFNIGAKLGVNISLLHPSISGLKIVAPDRYVCPENDVQIVSFIYDNESADWVDIAGQHVTNDAPGADIKDGRIPYFTYNRPATFNIDVWARVSPYSSISVKKYIGGGTWAVIATSPIYMSNTYVHWTASNISVSAGDQIMVNVFGAGVLPLLDGDCYAVAKLTYTAYSIYDTDYQNTELVYPSVGMLPYLGAFGQVSTNVFDGLYNHPDLGVLPRLSFAYYGYWVNAGDYSVRDLITFHAWATGVPILVSGKNVNFSKDGPLAKEVDGNIVEISVVSDKLGRATTIQYTDDENPQTLYFLSEFLSDDVKLYEAPFQYVRKVNGDYSNDLAMIPQYKGESSHDEDTNTTTWKFDFEKLNAAVIDTKQVNDRNGVTFYYASPFNRLNWQGVDLLNGRTIEVTFETWEDLRGYDYFYYEGRKYMIETADLDTSTGLCTVVALEVYTYNATN